MMKGSSRVGTLDANIPLLIEISISSPVARLSRQDINNNPRFKAADHRRGKVYIYRNSQNTGLGRYY